MSTVMRPFVLSEKPLMLEDQNTFSIHPMFIEMSENQDLDSIQKRECKSEIIHSGHFMVSQIDEQQDETSETVNTEPDLNQLETSGVQDHIQQIESTKEHKFNTYVKSNSPLGFIEEGLSKLFECMSLAYSGTITSPKWKTFKGLPLKLKDKIRLNNIIWRAWHIQYIIERDPRICKFSPLIDFDVHRKPESVVLEGKYWKRRPTTVILEYHKWRLYYKQTRNPQPIQSQSSGDLRSNRWFEWGQNQDLNNTLTLDDDFVMDFTDNLFSSFGPSNIIDFPNPREIARSGMGADFIQPGLTQLQPPVDDFVEPFSDFLSSKVAVLPTLHEETTADNESNKLTTKTQKCENATSLSNEFIPIFNQMLDLSQGNARNESYSSQNNILSEPSQLATNTMRVTDRVTSLEQVMRPNTQPLISNLSHKGSLQLYTMSRLSSSFEPQSLPVQSSHLPHTVPLSTQNQISDISDLRSHMVDHQQSYPNYDCELRMNSGSSSSYSNIEPSRLELSVLNQTEAGKTTDDSSNQFVVPKPINKSRTRSRSISIPELGIIKQQPAITSMLDTISSKPSDSGVERSNSLPVYTNRRNQTGPALNPQLVSKNFSIFTSTLNQMRPTTYSSSSAALNSASTASTPINSSFSSDISLNLLEQQMNYPHLYNSDSNLIAQLLSSNRGLQNMRTKGFEKMNEPSSTHYQPISSCPTNYTGSNEVLNYNCPSEAGNGSNSSQNLLIPSTARLTESNSMISNSKLARKISSPTMSPPLITSQFSPGSKDSSSNTPIHSPQSVSQSPSTSAKNYKPKSDQERLQYKEHRRVCHINAEQKRRCNIKNGFDTLRTLLPSVSQNINTKISKAAMLQKAADYIRTMKLERQQQQEEYENLKQQIENLNQTIGVFQSQLPATGAPISCQRTSQIRERYDVYIKERTISNWKFWIFSVTIIESLLDSYLSTVTTLDIEDMCRSVLRWLDQNCSLVTLRRDVLDSLRYLSTSTSILANPALLPQEIEAISNQSKNKLSH